MWQWVPHVEWKGPTGKTEKQPSCPFYNNNLWHRIPSLFTHGHPTTHAGVQASQPRRGYAILVIVVGASAMDRFLRPRRPIPIPTHASVAAASSMRDLRLLTALPEYEGGKRNKHTGVARSASHPVVETVTTALGMARLTPVRIPSEPVAGARRGWWVPVGGRGGEEDAREAMVPPHEIVSWRAATYTSTGYPENKGGNSDF